MFGHGTPLRVLGTSAAAAGIALACHYHTRSGGKSPTGGSFHSVPSFFVGLNHLYMYYYDGRKNRLTRCVVDIFSEVEPGVYQVQIHMNVDNHSHYQQCENLYDGVLTHYDALSTLIMKNQSMEMDNYQVGIPSPYMNAPPNGHWLWGSPAGL